MRAKRRGVGFSTSPWLGWNCDCAAYPRKEDCAVFGSGLFPNEYAGRQQPSSLPSDSIALDCPAPGHR